MNFKQKLGYMFIGCLFTIAGYILASLGGMTTHAQKDEQVLDEIICRKLRIVDGMGKTAADIDPFGINFYDIFGKRSASINGRIIRGMAFYNKTGKIVASIGASEDGGYIVFSNAAGERVVNIRSYENGGGIRVNNAAEKNLVVIGVDEGGSGFIGLNNTAGKDLVAIGSVEGRPNDGLINVYNHKGEWRSIRKD